MDSRQARANLAPPSSTTEWAACCSASNKGSSSRSAGSNKLCPQYRCGFQGSVLFGMLGMIICKQVREALTNQFHTLRWPQMEWLQKTNLTELTWRQFCVTNLTPMMKKTMKNWTRMRGEKRKESIQTIGKGHTGMPTQPTNGGENTHMTQQAKVKSIACF